MKKRIISLLLVACSLFLFGGCSKKKTDSVREEKAQGKILLNGFENQTDLTMLQGRNSFGKASLNKSNDFIKEGQGSLKVEITSEPWDFTSSNPLLYQATGNTTADYSDFKDVSSVSMYVYNAQSTPSDIGLQLIYTSSVTNWFTLEPGWNFIVCRVNRGSIPAKTVDEETSYSVSGINFIFERPKTNQVYYLDELSLQKTSVGFSNAAMELDEHEICSFDKAWQLDKMTAYCYGSSTATPTFSLNGEYTATGKGSSLKLTTAIVSGKTYWPQLRIDSQIWSKIDLSQYDDNDEFCFDMYSPYGNGLQAFELCMYTEGEQKPYFLSTRIDPEIGVWTTVRLTVAQLNGGGRVTSVNCFRNTSMMSLMYRSAGVEQVLYVDNIRMEVHE